jgi:hypothetical protein
MPQISTTTDYGYYWRYEHSSGEPQETFKMAVGVAGTLAYEEANKSGKNYVVASRPEPAPAVYVLACDHPELSALTVLYEFTPEGECIKPARMLQNVIDKCHLFLREICHGETCLFSR